MAQIWLWEEVHLWFIFFFKTDVSDVTGSEAKHIGKQSLILLFFSEVYSLTCVM